MLMMTNVSAVVSGLRQNLTLRSETDRGMGGNCRGVKTSPFYFARDVLFSPLNRNVAKKLILE